MYVIAVALVMALPFLSGLIAGQRTIPASTSEMPYEGAADAFQVFWEAWYHIEQSFCSLMPPEPQRMTRGAISGMLASLNDPYTVLVEPVERRIETDRLEGKFGGIGILLATTAQQVIVESVYPGSAAEQAGLQAGDILLAVDGVDLAGMLVEQAAILIRGEIGSTVRLQVRRDDEEEVDLSVVRQAIEVASLSWQMITDDIAYIHIHQFTARTGSEFSDALRLLESANTAGLVLDLRGNGGGLVGSAIEVLGHLVGHGIAYREVNRKGEVRHAIPFRADTLDWPLAVLVDGSSASAAEIVASAIQDYERGLVFGEPTFGKGSIQGIFPTSDGSSVHVTTSRWLSANGYPIQGIGVQPDIVVLFDKEHSTDHVLRAATEYLQEKRMNREASPPSSSIM